jgi:FAD/FMN-containing dehydrogenase
MAAPHGEAELCALVAQAQQAGQTVRVAGTGHSFIPLCASDGLLLSLDHLQGVISADRSTRRATVWAGSKIWQLGEPLLAAGLALENQGDIDRQAIAGAVSTGTHGTGRGIGSLSTQVVGLRIITATGELVECSATNESELFRAARTALGAFGVMSQITLACLPAYQLHERTWVEPFDECMAKLDEHIAATRHFEFFWSPGEDACAMKSLQPVVSDAPQSEPTVPPAAEGRLGRYMKSERVDWSYRIFPSERNVKFNECEFAIPYQNGPDCVREIRELMRTKHREVAWPIEYRTLGADDIDLGPAHGRETVTISIHQAAELPYLEFFKDAEAIFRNHRGRPHWGKWHSHTAKELRELYPQWDRFLAMRKWIDPKGTFLNGYLREMLGVG